MNIFVLGWYDNANLGDEAFKNAFCHLWPQASFTFSNTVKTFVPGFHSAIWLGGGDIFGGSQFLEIPADVPLAVIGVGFSSPNATVKAVLDRAKIVIVRDPASQAAYPRAWLASDLIFSLPPRVLPPSEKQVLILMNDFFSPKRHTPWSTAAHNAVFMIEMAKVVDGMTAAGKKVVFAPMGVGEVDDRRPAAQLISLLDKPGLVEWLREPLDDENFWNLIGRSELIITQRFHGMVYSAVAERSCVAVCGHKKMWELGGILMPDSCVDYYGFTDRAFYTALASQAKNFRGYKEGARALWLDLSALVAREFNLSAQNL